MKRIDEVRDRLIHLTSCRKIRTKVKKGSVGERLNTSSTQPRNKPLLQL